MEIIRKISSLCKNRKTLLLKNNEFICGNISYTNMTNKAIISNLYVDPLYRNHGYSTNLLQESAKLCSIIGALLRRRLAKPVRATGSESGKTGTAFTCCRRAVRKVY